MTNTEPTPDTSPEAVEAMCERLAAYRPQNEWGDGVRHVICDEAAAMLRAVAGERDTWRDKYNALAESALKHVGELGRDNGRKDVEIDAARASQKAAEAEVAALREALRPFAEVDLTGHGLPHDFAINVLAARAALKENHDGR